MKKLAGVYVKSIFILPFELSRYHLFCIAETLVWMLIYADCEICFSRSSVKEGDQLEQGSSILKMVFAHPSPCCKLLIALPWQRSWWLVAAVSGTGTGASRWRLSGRMEPRSATCQTCPSRACSCEIVMGCLCIVKLREREGQRVNLRKVTQRSFIDYRL